MHKETNEEREFIISLKSLPQGCRRCNTYSAVSKIRKEEGKFF